MCPGSSRWHQVFLTAQNIIEFWAVATRPREANGFGSDVEKTAEEVESLLNLFLFLEDSPAIFQNWVQLVSTGAVKGKQVHDARLIATMKAHSVTNLVTFNTDDFTRYTDITTVHPASIS